MWKEKAGISAAIASDVALIALYFDAMNVGPENMDDPDRDRFVMSKGHCVEALYAVLAAKGFFPIEEVIANFSKFGSKYIGHPNNKLPGIEMNSGSLGHGLPVATGMALAGKMDARDYRVYTVMGDGELAEGSVWEGAMAASHYKLDNRGRRGGRKRYRPADRSLCGGEDGEGETDRFDRKHGEGLRLVRDGEQGCVASQGAHCGGI